MTSRARHTLSLTILVALFAAPTVSAQQAPVRDRAPAQPVFSAGQAQVVPAFADTAQWIREDLWVETEFDSDGDGQRDRMHVAVTRQQQTETEGLKVPVVYETSPYYSGGVLALDSFWDVEHEVGEDPPARLTYPSIPHQSRRPRLSNSQIATWVPRGFAVVHSASPGTGLSQGCPTVGGPNESLAPKAVVDWLNGRAAGYTSPDGHEQVTADWATGKVGMTGTSYNGTLPLAAATTGVEGLEAIIPIAPNTGYYVYYRSNGLVRSPGGYLGEDVDVLYDYINSGDPARRPHCNAVVRDTEMKTNIDRTTGDYSDWWAARDYLNQLDDVRAATLMAHAFNDWNVMPEHSVRIIEALKQTDVPLQMYFHQGGHGGAPPLELMNRWFTRYLYDIDNGVEGDMRAWIVREGAERLEPVAYPDYPNPAATPVTLRLTGGAPGIGGLTLAQPARQGVETLVDNVSFNGAALAQAEQTQHRLLYATSELTAPVHISGTARVTIRVAADRAAANLSVWLVELPFTERPNQPTSVITRGWADPQNHLELTPDRAMAGAEPPRDGQPLVPGEFVTLTFNLQPDDQIVPAGKRIALMIMSSDREFTLWPEPGTELTVDLSATSIELPVVGGEAAWRAAGVR